MSGSRWTSSQVSANHSNVSSLISSTPPRPANLLGVTFQAVWQIGETAAEAVSIHTSRIQVDQLRIWPRRGSLSLDTIQANFDAIEQPGRWPTY